MQGARGIEGEEGLNPSQYEVHDNTKGFQGCDDIRDTVSDAIDRHHFPQTLKDLQGDSELLKKRRTGSP
jgi:hypothetical protein